MDRKTIKELIELWDVPEKVDKSTIRFTKLIKVRYSRAENIVNTIKEAYRDLLSANDKTFQDDQEGGDDQNKRGGGSQGVQGDGFNFGGLKGKLSLGPDALTNSILISAEGEDLMKIVEDVIRELDEAAQDLGSIEIYQATAGLNGNSVKNALGALLKRAQAQPPQQGKQEQAQQAPQGGGEQPNVNFERGQAPSRGRRGR